MGARMRSLDWSRTPLGMPDTWPQSLKTIIRVMLDSRYAMWMLWGTDLTFFCNDAYVPTVGNKRDWVLGARSDKVWEEIWPDIGPRIARVLSSGDATWDEGLLLFLERKGFLEETYHTFSYSPIYDDASQIAGMLCVVTEVTERIIGERRLRVLRDLAARSAGVETVNDSCRRIIAVLEQYPLDVPFSALYLTADEGRTTRLCAASVNLREQLLPDAADAPLATTPWKLDQVAHTQSRQHLKNLQHLRISAPAAPWPDFVSDAMALPIKGGGHGQLAGFIVVGISPRRALDQPYLEFFELMAGQVASALTNAQAYETERHRADSLLEIDRAKTAFFSNVSHEFRTPLTLILGPLADTLAEGVLPAAVHQRIEVAHRNSLRLLKLVNSLLDFSRIEAGRAQANYEPTDLASLTRDIASLFRSTIEQAGLKFEVHCDPLPSPVHVDRDMWEKIVLNLLSNAFKFTLEGGIRVELSTTGDGATLAVIDTGVGVPQEEVPRLFERFHRVEGTHGRTHEGTGIGLALVQELVRLHGGDISAKSTRGKGTAFTLHIPYGTSHLPPGRVSSPVEPANPSTADAFVQEALRWLPDAGEEYARPDGTASELDRRFESTFGSRIVLADDNADMRSYVHDLLAPRYRVEAVADGVQALDAIRRSRPALLISDVMMPNLDGFGLLQQIRADAELEGIPSILLSARAGGDSRIEGLDAGADDYLVKPFAARELLARVGALIELTQLRQAGEERLRLAIEGARMGTWDWNLATGSIQWSASHFEALGYTPRRDGVASYDLWRERLHPEDAARVESELADAVGKRSAYRTEYRIIRADTGEVCWLAAYGRVLGEGPGAVRRSVGIFLDITERKRAEEALREADRRKDEFLATLAHELRNPLAPVRNAARILAAEHLSAEQLIWCREVIQRQTQQMALLLDDLLDVSRITLGRLQLKKMPVELAKLVDSAVETVRPLIDARGHRLLLDLPATPLLLDVDPLRIAQVLANLLTNAAKYMDPGGDIVVSAHPIDGDLEIVVKDQGIGLDGADLNRVFVMFSQVDSALERSQGGLGIGLALVKGLLELHGGTVRATSEGLAKGSQFTIRLPGPVLREDKIVSPPVEDQVSAGGSRILIADDNQDAAASLAMLFEFAGHKVRTANDGAAALAIAEEFEPHVAFIDIGMPVLNGYEVAELLRREPWGKSIRLVALTGWGQPDSKERASLAGFDRHVTKPIDPAGLDRLLGELLTANVS
jgi:PAS domain S-box-containing protein